MPPRLDRVATATRNNLIESWSVMVPTLPNSYFFCSHSEPYEPERY